jgi:hypothetical protein
MLSLVTVKKKKKCFNYFYHHFQPHKILNSHWIIITKQCCSVINWDARVQWIYYSETVHFWINSSSPKPAIISSELVTEPMKPQSLWGYLFFFHQQYWVKTLITNRVTLAKTQWIWPFTISVDQQLSRRLHIFRRIPLKVNTSSEKYPKRKRKKFEGETTKQHNVNLLERGNNNRGAIF